MLIWWVPTLVGANPPVADAALVGADLGRHKSIRRQNLPLGAKCRMQRQCSFREGAAFLVQHDTCVTHSAPCACHTTRFRRRLAHMAFSPHDRIACSWRDGMAGVIAPAGIGVPNKPDNSTAPDAPRPSWKMHRMLLLRRAVRGDSPESAGVFFLAVE
jgi:hypothetical protein